MNGLRSSLVRASWLRGWLAVAVCWAWAAAGETLRVTSLDLREWPGGAPAKMSEVAAALGPQLPDVLLLQNVKDWKTCQELAAALKPGDYQVLLCSAFKGQNPQAAILSRHKAYFTWSEMWESAPAESAGYAFAAVAAGGRKVGLFSVCSAKTAGGKSERIRAQMESVSQWTANVPAAFLVGGQVRSDLDGLKVAGFEDAAPGKESGGALMVHSAYALGIDQERGRPETAALVSTVVELDPQRVAVLREARREAMRKIEEEARAVAAKAGESRKQAVRTNEGALPAVAAAGQGGTLTVQRFVVWSGAGVMAVVCVVAVILLRARSARLPLTAGADSSYLVVAPRSLTGTGSSPAGLEASGPLVQVDPAGNAATHSETWRQRALLAETRAQRAEAAVKAGLFPYLADMLRLRFVKRLLTDRKELMDAHEAAAQKAMEVDERLARVERQVEEQNRSYELRIAELGRELQQARSENRELIRARIEQVKAEMEAARARLLSGEDRTH